MNTNNQNIEKVLTDVATLIDKWTSEEKEVFATRGNRDVAKANDVREKLALAYLCRQLALAEKARQDDDADADDEAATDVAITVADVPAARIARIPLSAADAKRVADAQAQANKHAKAFGLKDADAFCDPLQFV